MLESFLLYLKHGKAFGAGGREYWGGKDIVDGEFCVGQARQVRHALTSVDCAEIGAAGAVHLQVLRGTTDGTGCSAAESQQRRTTARPGGSCPRRPHAEVGGDLPFDADTEFNYCRDWA